MDYSFDWTSWHTVIVGFGAENMIIIVDWCNENFENIKIEKEVQIGVMRHVWGKLSDNTLSDMIRITFDSEEDAMAFKLRWME